MRRTIYIATAVLLAAGTAGPALADCTSEVAQGISRQSNEKSWRKEANMISEQGPLKMMVEFQKPDRMRQVVTMLIEPKPVETILVGKSAWTNAGEGWKALGQADTEQLIKFFQTTTGQGVNDVSDFECVGAETIDGKQLRAYKGLPPEAKGPRIDGKPPQSGDQKNEAVRMVYLDPATGLPERSILAQAGKLDKPLFKEVYSYPTDIKIEAPADVKP
jgi:hypothetical protein